MQPAASPKPPGPPIIRRDLAKLAARAHQGGSRLPRAYRVPKPRLTRLPQGSAESQPLRLCAFVVARRSRFDRRLRGSRSGACADIKLWGRRHAHSQWSGQMLFTEAQVARSCGTLPRVPGHTAHAALLVAAPTMHNCRSMSVEICQLVAWQTDRWHDTSIVLVAPFRAAMLAGAQNQVPLFLHHKIARCELEAVFAGFRKGSARRRPDKQQHSKEPRQRARRQE